MRKGVQKAAGSVCRLNRTAPTKKMTTGYENDKDYGGEEGRHKNDVSNGEREFALQTKKKPAALGESRRWAAQLHGQGG